MLFRSDPFLEQEKNNAEYIESKGIGVIMRHHFGESVEKYLERALDNESELNSMKDNMAKIKAETSGHGVEAAMESLKRGKECRVA